MKGNSRKTGNEEYFTLPEVAKSCCDKFLELYPQTRSFLEPCAGNGSFSNYLREFGCVDEYDITPRTDRTIEQDFVELAFTKRYGAVITNPPFGRASNLAIKFFNHATKFSDLIAFIVPSSWRSKFFIQDKLDLNYHLAYTEDLPSKSFISPDGSIFEGEYLNCVFQIWEKRADKRTKMLRYRSKDFDFVRPDNVDKILLENAYDRELKPVFSVDKDKLIVIRTHGSRAGEILEGLHHNPRTVQWILPKKDGVEGKLSETNFTIFKDSNAYIPSLSPAEIAYSYDNSLFL